MDVFLILFWWLPLRTFLLAVFSWASSTYCSQELDQDLDKEPDLDKDLDQYPDLAPDQHLALDQDPDQGPALALELDQDLVLDLELDLDISCPVLNIQGFIFEQLIKKNKEIYL